MLIILFKVSESNLELLNKLIALLIISLMVATPIIILIGIMAIYRKYQKWRGIGLKKKAEKIIVKMNNTDPDSNSLDDDNEDEEIITTEQELIDKANDIKNQENLPPEEIDYSLLTIKELHGIAKSRGIKGFSRMAKAELIKKLS